MIWISTALVALVLAVGYVIKKKKPSRNFVPIRVVRKLVKANPSSLSVTVVDSGSEEAHAVMGSSSFLRSRGKPYRHGKYLYIAVPDKLKAGQSTVTGQAQLAALSFLYRGVPHSVVCRLEGRKRIDHNVASQLDESIEVACRIHPVGRIKKDERRSFLRYLTATDSCGAATPYISFDTFARKTNKPVAGQADGTELVDLKISDFKRGRRDETCAATVVNQLRAYMLVVQPGERRVDVARICDSDTLVSKIKTQIHHSDQSWSVTLLDLEEDCNATSFNIEQPSAPFSVDDRVVIHFDRRGKHFEMTAQVTQANQAYVTVRPTGPLTEETGLKLAMVDFSGGGTMVQGGRKLVEFLLGKPVKREEMSSDNPAHAKILRRLRRRFVHFTFYPRLHFPQVEKRFHPRLPHKICVLGQIMRSEFVKSQGKDFLRHGVKFIFDEHQIEEPQAEGAASREIAPWRIAWRRLKDGHGNRHFNEVHTKLGRLSGFLESQSRDGGGRHGIETEIRDNRVAFVMKERAAEMDEPRKRRSGGSSA